jgi:prepilin-type N-terminal cleavage/methylation domain-containing protein
MFKNSHFQSDLAKRRLSAFTLIELIVVVAIVGILATVVVINISKAQGKAKDTKRVADLQSIDKAIQLEAMTRPNATYYDSACNNVTWAVTDQNFSIFLIPSYMGKMPLDPVSRGGAYNNQYVYYSEKTSQPDTTKAGHSGGSCDNPTYTSSWYYLWTGLDTQNSKLANSTDIVGSITLLERMKTYGNPGGSVWNTSTAERQATDNFFVIRIGN